MLPVHAQVLARRARGSLWSLEQAPATPALAALRLWSAMLDCEPLRDGERLPLACSTVSWKCLRMSSCRPEQVVPGRLVKVRVLTLHRPAAPAAACQPGWRAPTGSASWRTC